MFCAIENTLIEFSQSQMFLEIVHPLTGWLSLAIEKTCPATSLKIITLPYKFYEPDQSDPITTITFEEEE